jgi:hypothetical protein
MNAAIAKIEAQPVLAVLRHRERVVAFVRNFIQPARAIYVAPAKLICLLSGGPLFRGNARPTHLGHLSRWVVPHPCENAVNSGRAKIPAPPKLSHEKRVFQRELAEARRLHAADTEIFLDCFKKGVTIHAPILIGIRLLCKRLFQTSRKGRFTYYVRRHDPEAVARNG